MKKQFIEFIIAELLIIIAVSISFIPTLYYVSLASNTTMFPLIHNNHSDYYFYLSLMRQGFEGKWLVTSRFTPEHFQPQFIQTFFVFLGFLSRISSIDLPIIYTLSRLILGLAVGLSAYYLLVLFDKRRAVHIVGLIFVLFGSGFWFIKDNQIQRFLTFWTAFDARERTTFLPHHLFGTVSIIMSIILLSLFFNSGKKKFLFFACLVGFIGTFINPISLGNFFFALVIFVPLFFAVNFKTIKNNFKKFITPLFLYLTICAVPFLYLWIIEHTTFPWNKYGPGSVASFPVSFKEYILGLGLVLIFALLGLTEIFKRKSFLSLILFAWFIAPFIGIFVISKFFKFGNIYFLYAAQYVPIGIIGAVGFISFVEWLAKKVRLKREIILVPLMLILILYFSVSWYASLKSEMSRWTPNLFNIFLPKDFISAFNFLNSNSRSDSIVLTGEFLGNMIPAFTHNRTVLGHMANTYDPTQKEAEMSTFFSQTDPIFAKKLIKKYNISYVFYTYDTGVPQVAFIDGVGLQKIYQNPTVTIFKTKTD